MRTLDEMDDQGKVAALGDWHGNTRYAVKVIHRLGGIGVRRFVHTGDFGYNFRTEFILALDEALRGYDADLIFVPGNHEDYDYLGSVTIDADGAGRIGDRIVYLPRGVRWSWEGQMWMGLGGAASIDRVGRIQDGPDRQWWPQELITPADVQRAITGGHVDILITHDAPASVHIAMPPFSWIPPEDEAAARNQRQLLDQVVEAVTPQLLVHGHHHLHLQTHAVTLSGHEYLAVSLDCDGSPIEWNTHIFR